MTNLGLDIYVFYTVIISLVLFVGEPDLFDYIKVMWIDK